MLSSKTREHAHKTKKQLKQKVKWSAVEESDHNASIKPEQMHIKRNNFNKKQTGLLLKVATMLASKSKDLRIKRKNQL